MKIVHGMNMRRCLIYLSTKSSDPSILYTIDGVLTAHLVAHQDTDRTPQPLDCCRHPRVKVVHVLHP